MTTFFEITAEELVKKSRIVKIGKMIDWEKMRYRFKKIHKTIQEEEKVYVSQFGQKPYDVMSMVKAIVLQQWHSLSDPGLEEALHVRIDFLLFCGFNPEEGIPDETTICRFRNKLAEKKLDKVLLRLINEQLESKGLKIEESKGAVVDATIVESCCRARKVIEIKEDRKENKEEAESSEDSKNCEIEESKDTEARWLKKGKKSYYGYKAFARTDVEDGYIEEIHVESANVSEMKHLDDVLNNVSKGRRIYADKAYGFKANRESLKEKNLKDALMRKATRGKQLKHWEKVFNKLVSKERYIVEQTFGTLKRIFEAGKSSYRGKRKTENQMVLKSISLNLLKAFRKKEYIESLPSWGVC
jgi:transposase, IS5 family